MNGLIHQFGAHPGPFINSKESVYTGRTTRIIQWTEKSNNNQNTSYYRKYRYQKEDAKFNHV